MFIGKSSGEGRAMEAAKLAINSKLLETSINGATGIIMNVTGGPDMTLHEVNEAASVIHDAVSDDAEVIFGSVIDDRIQGEIMITIIATGFELKNGDTVTAKDDLKLSAASFFGGNGAGALSFGNLGNSTPSTGANENQNHEATASSLLDIPEFLNPKNRL